MGNHYYSDVEHHPRAIELVGAMTACKGDINAALTAMQPPERAGSPMEHLRLKSAHFRLAATMFEKTNPEWAQVLNAHAASMDTKKQRGR